MPRTVRAVLIPLLAATLFGAALAPAAHAAPVAHRHAIRQESLARLWWAPNGVGRTVRRGVHHEFTVVAHFRSSVMVRNAAFAFHFDGGLYARPSTLYWGTIWPNMRHDLSFTVVVPSGVRAGWYEGNVRLVRREGIGDYDRLSAPFTVDVHVANQAPPPNPPVITWSAGLGLGTITLQQGQSVIETASFSSSVNLTNLQAKFSLGSFALNNGLSVTLLSTIPATLSAGVSVPVTISISAAPTATVRGYQDVLYLMGSQNGGALARLWHDVDFGIDVDRAPVAQVIYWIPSQHLGTFTVQRGQTITATAEFTSSVALSNMAVRRTLSDYSAEHGVAVTVISTSPATTSVAANTPVTVTFTVAAGPAARIGIYHGTDLHVDASTPTNSAVTGLRNDADLIVDVDAIPGTTPVISWSAHHNNFGTITLRQGRSMNVALSFSSSVSLTNVSVRSSLNEFARQHGVAVGILSLTPNTTSLVANASETVQFRVSASPSAPVGVYAADLHVDGSRAGAATASLQPQVLHFKVDVDAA